MPVRSLAPIIGLQIAAVVISTILYYLLLFVALRSHTYFPAFLFCGLFALHALLYHLAAQNRLLYLIALGGAVLFRVIALFAIPNLSDDFYRFIWDGRLLASDINPYAHLPDDFMTGLIMPPVGITCELYERLNSPLYFTVYPPVCQFVFWLSAIIAPNSIYGAVLVMKSVLLLCELGSITLLIRLLYFAKLPFQRVLLYALNPLVIAEIIGNIHFEGVLFFLLLCMLYGLWVRSNILLAAISLGLAICTKLLPLIFMPFLLLTLRYQQAIRFGCLVGLVIICCFLPFFNTKVINAIFSSSSLYYNKFEFNAGLYYLLRQLGFWVYGYNIIGWLGKFMAVMTGATIIALSVYYRKTKGLGTVLGLFWVYWLYLFFATTVHPWYIVPLLGLSLFTPYRFPVIWSAVVLLSYSTYYHNSYTENLYLVSIEYIIVGIWLLWELFQNKLKSRLKLLLQVQW